MKPLVISKPELAMVASTRGLMGAGIALLVGDHLRPDQRKAAGWALFLVGALSTIPLAMEVLGRRSSAPPERPIE
jgi:hypothetical protein